MLITRYNEEETYISCLFLNIAFEFILIVGCERALWCNFWQYYRWLCPYTL